MKKKKSLFIALIVILIIAIVTTSLYFVLSDKNKLTVNERNWINENISTVQNINVVNNLNVFGKDGKGVYYDFIESLEKEYGLTMNAITFNSPSTPSGITLGAKTSISDNDIVFFKDHYVMVGKNSEIISKEESLNGKKVGILSANTSYVTKYLKKASNISFVQYETEEELISAMTEELSYMIVPLTEYLDYILSNNYHIIYHFSDAYIYYTMQTTDEILSNVLNKYYNKWQDKFNDVYNKELFKTFKTALKLSDTEIDSMQSISYNYGFVNTSPYEVIMGGKYGGIVAVYLSKFSDFADVEFNFIKYKNFKKFEKAIKNEEIDVFFNYYNLTNYNKTAGIDIEYVIAASRKDSTVIKSINSLIGKTVYVEENSKIYDYVKSIEGINVKTYSDYKELFKLNKKDTYIIVDKNTFEFYSNSKLDNYTVRHSDFIKDEYTFNVRTSSALYNLLNKYMETLDENEVILEGLENHHETIKSGGFITRIAEYILYLVIIIILVVLIILKKSKKISIARKIKKEDKMKFIDQLTSLKNRNFLNENIETWNNNTIYPQTIVVIDLNKVQEINDLYGYNEGDKQIKALANVLVKTQLDNSEIMRTDGNEFVIYLVGYNQKQVTNYIHKLNKEIKKLPYEFGAEFGYSMIIDDIKTIEDALNEAVEDMKKQKVNKDETETKG